MNDARVKEYFDRITYEFDNIYDNRGSFLTRIINRLFRGSFSERVLIAIRECGELRNKTLLDIGCGSGRVSFTFARRGADVTGIDYSSNMIKLAEHYRNIFKIDNVEFKLCDFMRDFDLNIRYDISVALGVLDYIEDPIPFLSHMKKITKERMIASYPAKYTFQMPIRKVWLYTRNCPVYFYTEDDLERMYTLIGVHDFKITRYPEKARMATGYLVTAWQ